MEDAGSALLKKKLMPWHDSREQYLLATSRSGLATPVQRFVFLKIPMVEERFRRVHARRVQIILICLGQIEIGRSDCKRVNWDCTDVLVVTQIVCIMRFHRCEEHGRQFRDGPIDLMLHQLSGIGLIGENEFESEGRPIWKAV
jgi:hypothetical protein